MQRFLSVFSQPYPFNYVVGNNSLKQFLKSCTEGLFVALFLILFQPFGINNWHSPDKLFHLAMFGVITTLCSLFVRLVIVPSFPKIFMEENWTVGKEILLITSVLLLIAAGNYLYSSLMFFHHFGWGNFFWSCVDVLLIGMFPVAFGIVSNYIYQLKKYQKPVSVKHEPHAEPQTEMTFIAENEKDTFTLHQNDLLYIESADNYVVFYYTKDGSIQKELLRSSLSRLETQIASPEIVRCHRSFIVNLDKVASVSGNAQGYKFHLTTHDIVVPVARRYSVLVERLR